MDQSTSQHRALKRLAKIERRINKYGGRLLPDQWITYKCGLVDADGQLISRLVDCGDLASRKSLTCGSGNSLDEGSNGAYIRSKDADEEGEEEEENLDSLGEENHIQIK